MGKERERLQELKDIYENVDIRTVKREDLYNIIRTGANIVNRNLGTFTKAKETSLATSSIRKKITERFGEDAKGFKFNKEYLDSLSINQLKRYTNEILYSSQLKTLNIQRARIYEHELEERVKEGLGININWSKETKNVYWDIYNLLMNSIGGSLSGSKDGSKQVQIMLTEFMTQTGKTALSELTPEQIYEEFTNFIKSDPRYKNLEITKYFTPLQGGELNESSKKRFEKRKKKWYASKVNL